MACGGKRRTAAGQVKQETLHFLLAIAISAILPLNKINFRLRYREIVEAMELLPIRATVTIAPKF